MPIASQTIVSSLRRQLKTARRQASVLPIKSLTRRVSELERDLESTLALAFGV